ncbi:MAG: AAA family ATPase [Deltaproteobacteria bacterium]|nr:AAA family ATPase [Deltaproteobacteria bacterium]
MSALKHVQIKGFRRLYDLDLDMRPLMVMIGANGVGKTSLLDVFSLLSASAAGNLNIRLNSMGGVADILTFDRGQELSLSIDKDVPGHNPLKYSFTVVPEGPSYAISSETLSQVKTGYPESFKYIYSIYDDIRYYEGDEGKLVRPNWDHNPMETSLSQVPKMFRQTEELRRILSSATQYHVLDVRERAPVKLPQQMKPAELPGEDGQDLVPFLYYLRETDFERYDTIIDTLKSAFGGFESLQFPPVAAGMLAMTWKDKQFKKPMYMHQLSEGTLRFLWLVALLQSPGLSTITMIDEPEVSLHPELLSILLELMREASQRTQLIVATHSDRLIRFLKPEEVVIMDIMDDGCAGAVWSDSCDLEEWLAEYSLDEVWRMGRMGGRS